MTYQARLLAPKASAFHPVSGSDVGDAASNFLGSRLDQALFVRPENYDSEDGETAYFAMVEVEGAEPVCVRYFYSGIGRKGGVQDKRHPNERASLAEVERSLGLESGFLSGANWRGEETAEEAWQRKFKS